MLISDTKIKMFKRNPDILFTIEVNTWLAN